MKAKKLMILFMIYMSMHIFTTDGMKIAERNYITDLKEKHQVKKENEIDEINKINDSFSHLSNKEKVDECTCVTYTGSTFRCQYISIIEGKRVKLIDIRNPNFGECVYRAQQIVKNNPNIPDHIAGLTSIEEIREISKINEAVKNLNDKGKAKAYNGIHHVLDYFICKYWDRQEKKEKALVTNKNFGKCVYKCQQIVKNNLHIANHIAQLKEPKDISKKKPKLVKPKEMWTSQCISLEDDSSDKKISKKYVAIEKTLSESSDKVVLSDDEDFLFDAETVHGPIKKRKRNKKDNFVNDIDSKEYTDSEYQLTKKKNVSHYNEGNKYNDNSEKEMKNNDIDCDSYNPEYNKSEKSSADIQLPKRKGKEKSHDDGVIEKLENILQWCVQHKKYPSTKERQYYDILGYQNKKLKTCTNSRIKNLMKKIRDHDMKRDHDVIEKLEEILQWCVQHKKYPSQGQSCTPEERQYNKFLYQNKKLEISKNSRIKNLIKKIREKETNYEQVKIIKCDDDIIKKLKNILQWCEQHKKYPSSNQSRTPEERKYYKFLYDLYQNKKLETCKNSRIKNLMKKIREKETNYEQAKISERDDDVIEKLEKILQWCVQHKKYPSQGKSSTPKERQYYEFLRHQNEKLETCTNSRIKNLMKNIRERENKVKDAIQKINEKYEHLENKNYSDFPEDSDDQDKSLEPSAYSEDNDSEKSLDDCKPAKRKRSENKFEKDDKVQVLEPFFTNNLSPKNLQKNTVLIVIQVLPNRWLALKHINYTKTYHVAPSNFPNLKLYLK